MSESIKVNFMLGVETKKKLDLIKKKARMTNSGLLDKLLQFDDEAAQLFVSIYQQENHKRIKDYNYLELRDGAIIYGRKNVDLIKNSRVLQLSEVDSIRSGVENISRLYDKENNQLEEIFEGEQGRWAKTLEKVVVHTYQVQTQLLKRIEILENEAKKS